jgi:hypothetical protein
MLFSGLMHIKLQLLWKLTKLKMSQKPVAFFFSYVYILTFAVEISKPQKKSLMMGTFRLLVSCVMN